MVIMYYLEIHLITNMTLEARPAVIFAFSLNIVATRTNGTTATGAQDAEHSVVTCQHIILYIL